MDEIAKKVSEYQVFNFLLPGTIFAAAITRTTTIDLLTDNLLVAIFVYYFIGLVISRVGSIIIGPALKLIKIVKFAPYSKYVEAAKNDPLLPILSQENNTYRTLISATTIYLIVYLLNTYRSIFDDLEEKWIITSISVALILLFTLSYKKQTSFIVRWIGKNK